MPMRTFTWTSELAVYANSGWVYRLLFIVQPVMSLCAASPDKVTRAYVPMAIGRSGGMYERYLPQNLRQ